MIFINSADGAGDVERSSDDVWSDTGSLSTVSNYDRKTMISSIATDGAGDGKRS